MIRFRNVMKRFNSSQGFVLLSHKRTIEPLVPSKQNQFFKLDPHWASDLF